MHTASCSLLDASVDSAAMIENKEAAQISSSIDDKTILPHSNQLILYSFTGVESIPTTFKVICNNCIPTLNPKIKQSNKIPWISMP